MILGSKLAQKTSMPVLFQGLLVQFFNLKKKNPQNHHYVFNHLFANPITCFLCPNSDQSYKCFSIHIFASFFFFFPHTCNISLLRPNGNRKMHLFCWLYVLCMWDRLSLTTKKSTQNKIVIMGTFVWVKRNRWINDMCNFLFYIFLM